MTTIIQLQKNAYQLPEFTMPDHLSPSQLRTFTQCGIRWALGRPRDGQKVHEPGWGPRLRGESLDKAATEHFRQKADDEIGLSEKDFISVAVEYHRKNEWITKFAEPEHVSRDRSAKQAKLYFNSYAQQFMPYDRKTVQMEVTYKDNGLMLPVVGIIDLVTIERMVVDTKVKKKPPTQNEVDRDVQLTTYCMMTGAQIAVLAIVTDETNPRVVHMLTTRTQRQIDAVKSRYNLMYYAIKANALLPARENDYLCNAKYCSFFDICDFGAREGVEEEQILGIDE